MSTHIKCFQLGQIRKRLKIDHQSSKVINISSYWEEEANDETRQSDMLLV